MSFSKTNKTDKHLATLIKATQIFNIRHESEDIIREMSKILRASQVVLVVKNPPAMLETLAQFLGQEGPVEKGYTTHSSTLGHPLWLSW